MKIVHLNTHSYGGAAVVARRLHRAALAGGVESHFITKYGAPGDAIPQHHAMRDARLLYALRAASAHPLMNRVGRAVQRRMQHRNLANRPIGFEVFSPLNDAREFADCLQIFEPDVIHLHWISGFVDHSEFFRRNVDRKFVWTLHDMNPLTGGCHHSDGCMGYQGECGNCPQLAGTIDEQYAAQVLASKREMLGALRDDQMVIASPSRWLLELSRKGAVTRRFAHLHVPNPTLDAGNEKANGFPRRELGLPTDKKIVAFVSDNLRNPRKGIDLLFAAIRSMAEKESIHLLGLGQRTDAPADLAVSFPGRITEEHVLARYLSCADALVSPSVAENSPLAVIEALACGVPAISFEVGGAGELIDEECGRVVLERSPQALANAMTEVLFRRSYDRAAIRARAAVHAPATVFDKYLGIYRALLNDRVFAG